MRQVQGKFQGWRRQSHPWRCAITMLYLFSGELERLGNAGAFQVLFGAELEGGLHLLACWAAFLEYGALQVASYSYAQWGNILRHDAAGHNVEGVDGLLDDFVILEIGDADISRAEA